MADLHKWHGQLMCGMYQIRKGTGSRVAGSRKQSTRQGSERAADRAGTGMALRQGMGLVCGIPAKKVGPHLV